VAHLPLVLGQNVHNCAHLGGAPGQVRDDLGGGDGQVGRDGRPGGERARMPAPPITLLPISCFLPNQDSTGPTPRLFSPAPHSRTAPAGP